MIPSALNDLLKINLLLILLLPAAIAKAQPDTIVVYEYIHKTDTVWVEPEPVRDTLVIQQLESIECATLYFDSIRKKAGLVVFSNGASATIPINRIILGGNKNQTEMKQKGFFTLLLFSMQSILCAQPTLDFYTGTTSHWFQHNTSTISNPMWLGAHMGAGINLPFKNPKWEISTGFELHFVFPTGDYKQIKAIDETLPYIERDFAQIQTNVIINELNTGLFEKPFKQVTVPVKLGYNLGNWKPFAGFAYSYTYFLYNTNAIRVRTRSFHDFSLMAGTSYSFSDKLGLKLSLYKGIADKYNAFEDFISPTAGMKEYYFQSVYATLSFVFTL
ncbi:MAG: porin family protein [Prolixibacteraceae bacterium]|nr:porin family protein [Prolixibacteraceae bacterium]